VSSGATPGSRCLVPWHQGKKTFYLQTSSYLTYNLRKLYVLLQRYTRVNSVLASPLGVITNKLGTLITSWDIRTRLGTINAINHFKRLSNFITRTKLIKFTTMAMV
jgi:hypothetical protein